MTRLAQVPDNKHPPVARKVSKSPPLLGLKYYSQCPGRLCGQCHSSVVVKYLPDTDTHGYHTCASHLYHLLSSGSTSYFSGMYKLQSWNLKKKIVGHIVGHSFRYYHVQYTFRHSITCRCLMLLLLLSLNTSTPIYQFSSSNNKIKSPEVCESLYVCRHLLGH